MEFKLIIKKLNNTLNESETDTFNSWYNESPEHKAYFHRVKQQYENTPKRVETRNAWAKVFYKINNKSSKAGYLKYAAAITVFLAITSLWLLNRNAEIYLDRTPPIVSTPKEDKIEVGTDKATLTLEDGSKVTLEEGQQFSAGNVSSDGKHLIYDATSNKKTIAQNILDIPRGGQFYVVLADGTKVWVNAETRLKYPVEFIPGESRKVELVYGEAYFEVSPSEEHNGANFIVMTGEHEVEVLGTQFNVKAYEGEDHVATTLVEGKVKIDNAGKSLNLEPGFQSKLDLKTSELRITPADVDNETSWKNGYFSFKNKSLEDIMKVLSRWYDFEVKFQDKDLKHIAFNGVFRRATAIEDILDIIRQTNEINFEINQKTITVK
ncbi:FecR family protein [Pseudozobellia sp. WGM2]|uniref:FecR family protein n=1 Tax=Pseudozobellia sp. WGM2 TaxID=2787625 RepID=UPI001AE0450F|nr:FecR domain-containing protein [Pseudozobellia sp. WGM2]